MRVMVAALLLLAGAKSLATAAEPSWPEPAKLPVKAELPDPLVTFGGERITTKEQWFEKRRPELKQLLQHYMYGYLPAAPAKVEAKLEREDKQALGGKATLREIELSFGPPETPKLHLLLITPNGRKGPSPVFLGLNFRGNHTVLNDPKIRLTTAWLPGNYPGVKDNRATDTGRGTQADAWNVEQIIERGYALATIYNGEIAPDRPDAPERMQLHYPKKAEGQPGPHDWATIAAWSWGLHRAVDFLVTDSAIDKAKIVVVGHSRLGKTALVAAAFDDRIAISMPHQAGCGGTAPSRGKVGESVKQINDRFPHWFNATFKQFNEQTERLPFDQHCLAAVVAPRPVLFTNAVEDTWANPDGQFQVLQAADPVYRLLGAGGLDAKKPPEINTLIDSKLGYFIRPGKHSMTKDDWKVFLDFADKHLGKPNG